MHTISSNAFDASQFPQPPAQQVQHAADELGIAPRENVILGVFRLSEEKDPFGFIEVIKHVASKVPFVKALIVGVGALQAELEARVRDYGLGENVSF